MGLSLRDLGTPGGYGPFEVSQGVSQRFARQEASSTQLPQGLPARELLGEMLLESKQPVEALVAFETALRQADSTHSRGAACAHLSGDREKAESYYARLLAIAIMPTEIGLNSRMRKRFQRKGERVNSHNPLGWRRAASHHFESDFMLDPRVDLLPGAWSFLTARP